MLQFLFYKTVVACTEVLYKKVLVSSESLGDHNEHGDYIVKRMIPRAACPSFQSHIGRTANKTKASAARRHDAVIVNGALRLYSSSHVCCLHGFVHIASNHVIRTLNLSTHAIKTNTLHAVSLHYGILTR